MDGISKDTFEKMDTDSKLNVLFDYIVDFCKNAKILEDRYEGLEKKSTRWGAIGGFITAVAAYLATLFIGHMTSK